MKTILIKLTILASFVFAFIACSDQMGETDSRLSAVSDLIEPVDAKAIELVPSTAATVYFEWEYCKTEESGAAVYQIAFDKANGDFSNPVYLAVSDNNGMTNHASISHKQMNKIASMVGIKSSETGTFKWTVFSSKGLKAEKATVENTITITRLAGYDEVDWPLDVYVTGEGSEGGTDLSKAQKMKSIGNGVFEAYTQLTAGKPFNFTDGISGTPRVFYTDDKLIIRQDGSSTIPTTGVYLLTLDFDMGISTYTLVTRISFYFSPEGKTLFDLPYIGYGVFQAKGQTVTFKQEGWGRDERYKFRIFMKENGGANTEKELELNTLNGTDSRPTPSSPTSYYYVKLSTNVTQWDDKWKLMGDFDGVSATYTIYLQADQPYTHSMTK